MCNCWNGIKTAVELGFVLQLATEQVRRLLDLRLVSYYSYFFTFLLFELKWSVERSKNWTSLSSENGHHHSLWLNVSEGFCLLWMLRVNLRNREIPRARNLQEDGACWKFVRLMWYMIWMHEGLNLENLKIKHPLDKILNVTTFSICATSHDIYNRWCFKPKSLRTWASDHSIINQTIYGRTTHHWLFLGVWTPRPPRTMPKV